jgi:hypothetical protein
MRNFLKRMRVGRAVAITRLIGTGSRQGKANCQALRGLA